MATSPYRGTFLLAGAAGLPLAYCPWFRDAYETPKLILLALCATLALLEALCRRGETRAGSDLDLPLAAFTAAVLASAWGSIDPDLSWSGSEAYRVLGVPAWAACLSAFWLGCAAARERGPEFARRLISWTAAASVPVSVVALIQLGSGGGRALATFGESNALGTYLAMALPLAVHAFRSGAGARRWGALAAAALAAGGLFAAASRGAWLAAALALLAYAALSGKRRTAAVSRAFRWTPWRCLVLGSLMLAGAGGTARGIVLRGTGPRQSDSSRLLLWRIAAQGAREPRLLGSGPATFSIRLRRLRSEALGRLSRSKSGAEWIFGHAHNDWFEVLATLGAAGLLAYLWLHAAALRRLRLLASQDPDWRSGSGPPLAAALLAVFIQAKFNIPALAVAWFACLCAACLLCPAPGRPEAGAPALRGGLLLLLALSVLWTDAVAARVAVAEASDRAGRKARGEGRAREAAVHFERALAWRPGSVVYRYDLANLLWDAAAGAGAEERRVLLERAVGSALAGLRRRPREAELQRLLGLSELRRAALAGEKDRLPFARRAFDAALALDPFRPQLLRDAAETAALQGEEPARRGYAERLERLASIY